MIHGNDDNEQSRHAKNHIELTKHGSTFSRIWSNDKTTKNESDGISFENIQESCNGLKYDNMNILKLQLKLWIFETVWCWTVWMKRKH